MENLTEYQSKALGAIIGRTCEYPITGTEVANIIGLKPRKTGIEGADMRSIIHALRVKGYPVCASGAGYWWPQNGDELNAYIQSFQNRVNDRQSALDGMRAGFDKVGSPVGQNEAKPAISMAMYEVDGTAREVPTDKIAEFMAQYPNARKLS